MFLRRGVSGAPWLDVHCLELAEGGWRILGGSAEPSDGESEARPRLADLHGPALTRGRGGNPPAVTALDASGHPLGSVPVSRLAMGGVP